MLSEEARIREDICRFGRSLFERGLTSGSSGNISIRLADGGILATPTNSSLGFLDPARLSRLNDAGRLVSGDPPPRNFHCTRRCLRHGTTPAPLCICIRPILSQFPCSRMSIPRTPSRR